MKIHSPFPGMDPFLEEPTRWSSIHFRLIGAISDRLTELLEPAFSVEVEQRVYILTGDDLVGRQPIVPDIYLITGGGVGGTAVADTITPPLLLEPLDEFEIREHYIEIRDSKNHEVITTIEVLSPFNKERGTQGQQAFLNKRWKVMRSQTHWVEIDLLRAGERPKEVAGKSDYYALLKRGGTPGPYEVWYFNVRDTMPNMAIPLRPPHPDIVLHLQTAFDELYKRGHYYHKVDYSEPVPLPRLQPADAAWVQRQIQTWQQPETL